MAAKIFEFVYIYMEIGMRGFFMSLISNMMSKVTKAKFKFKIHSNSKDTSVPSPKERAEFIPTLVESETRANLLRILRILMPIFHVYLFITIVNHIFNVCEYPRHICRHIYCNKLFTTNYSVAKLCILMAIFNVFCF